jgi:hypothetical protein
MTATRAPSQNATLPHPRSRRPAKRLIAIAIAIPLILVGVLMLPDPFGPPTSLHMWGHDYTSTGEFCMVGPCFGDPPPAAPITMQAAREASAVPVVVHSLVGVLGWFGLTDAGPKPAIAVWRVYLQVGPDAYIPYKWVTCCEAQW